MANVLRNLPINTEMLPDVSMTGRGKGFLVKKGLEGLDKTFETPCPQSGDCHTSSMPARLPF
ncbi:MAG: hypothetical protein EA412_00895 [Chitinophagaceae bacterium]|nr:MAG: hypothetical protein EA412_00895 [Chitinophagaceae bacterium]